MKKANDRLLSVLIILLIIILIAIVIVYLCPNLVSKLGIAYNSTGRPECDWFTVGRLPCRLK